MFGQQARRVMTVIDRQPQAGACDQSKQRMETDGWYIDAPKALAAQPPSPPPASGAACRDDIKANVVGDAGLLGFPIAYTTTAPGADGKPVIVMQMEVTEFEVTNLDASLFDIPQGMTAAANGARVGESRQRRERSEACGPHADSERRPPKKAGVIRVGVPELANKTTQSVDTRALRTQLIAELAEQKMEGVPLAAAPQDELECLRERSWLRLPACRTHHRAEGLEAGQARTDDQGHCRRGDRTKTSPKRSYAAARTGRRHEADDSRRTRAATTAASGSRPASDSRVPPR